MSGINEIIPEAKQDGAPQDTMETRQDEIDMEGEIE